MTVILEMRGGGGGGVEVTRRRPEREVVKLEFFLSFLETENESGKVCDFV